MIFRNVNGLQGASAQATVHTLQKARLIFVPSAFRFVYAH
jgi:hypothetical protein